MKLRVDASIDRATAKLERFARLSGELATAEAAREAAIADTNAVADTLALPIVEEMNLLRAELEPWWRRNGHMLLTGKRKTAELGGCMVGFKASRTSLLFEGGSDKAAMDAALAALQDCRWAKPYIRVSYAVDKVATTKGLSDKHAAGLKEIGFSTSATSDVFVLDRVVQEGTIAGSAK